MMYSDAEGSDG